MDLKDAMQEIGTAESMMELRLHLSEHRDVLLPACVPGQVVDVVRLHMRQASAGESLKLELETSAPVTLASLQPERQSCTGLSISCRLTRTSCWPVFQELVCLLMLSAR